MEMILGEKREFGDCDVEIENKKVEPRPEIRGDIARTYRYMDKAYPGKLMFKGLWASSDHFSELRDHRRSKGVTPMP
jgi:endonuclease I